ncbi:3-oxoacyl-ACP synthase III family protein [Streptomyces sp. NPDC001930]|uniref:3-oxoacyl-ACP synthase III family protein n=1 Tax=Streptomyces sp. NPDC001930 TaxID=3364625 RepID=UPI0036B63716
MSDQSVRLLSVGTALPGTPVDNAMLASTFHRARARAERIGSATGIDTRHLGFDIETGKQNYSLVDLGSEAGGKALWAARLRPHNIDLVVLGTSAPGELSLPAVDLVAARLGIHHVVTTLQIRSGCAGAVQAFSIARRLLICGRHRTALVIGAEVTPSPYTPGVRADAHDPSRLLDILVLGDGAGAAILTTDPAGHEHAAGGALLSYAGSNHASERIVEWHGAGGLDGPRPQEPAERGTPPTHGEGEAADDSAADLAAETWGELLQTLQWDEDDIDFLLPPQVSHHTAGRVTRLLAVPDTQQITCVREIGNTGNAALFFQLQQLLPRMGAGDRAVGVSVEPGRRIKSGLAVEMRLNPV